MARYVTSPAGFKLIKAFEGFRAKAAPLETGGWVIGYGHTVSARKGIEVDEKDASDLLKWDVSRLEAPLCDLIFAPLNSNQFDALVSLVFNIGLSNFKTSALLKRLNEGCPVGAAEGFDEWRRAFLAGEVIIVDALVRRRAAEKALFLATPDASVIAPTPQLPPLRDSQITLEKTNDTPVKVLFDLEGNSETIIEPTDIKAEQEETLVSLDEAFETEDITTETKPEKPLDDIQVSEPDKDDDLPSPVTEIAEQIAGRLNSVASELEPEPQDEVLQLTEADRVVEHTAPAKPDEDKDTPPLVDEKGILLEPYEAETPSSNEFLVSGNDTVTFQYDEPQYDDPKIEPQTISGDAKITTQSGDFQPAYDRGRWVFILIGIIGIAMTLGGLWQIQNTTSITDNLDFIKGPGQALLGVLSAVIAAYYLLRRLQR